MSSVTLNLSPVMMFKLMNKLMPLLGLKVTVLTILLALVAWEVLLTMTLWFLLRAKLWVKFGLLFMELFFL